MAKTYIDTVKYLIYSNVDIGGLVEKPDVVGAIFGQTEGLLGDELDLRDLQKNGRIGRIEVDLEGRDGRTQGVIKVPSSLDMVETCIIAAALETVDRVGPCEASMKITRVEDTRNIKRKVLVDRAKGLLKALISTELPESREISELVRGDVKAAEIVEYGPDKLPAGPHIDRTNEVIFVEGRADVLNLLKNDMTNVVAIQGAKITPTIIKLSKEKEVTVFLDGDRGGDIILNELVQGGAELDFIARAPVGKEVEELTRKEIIKCIRSKVPFEQGKEGEGKEAGGRPGGVRREYPRREGEGRGYYQQRERGEMRYPRRETREFRPAPGIPIVPGIPSVPNTANELPPAQTEARPLPEFERTAEKPLLAEERKPKYVPPRREEKAIEAAETPIVPVKVSKEDLSKELDGLNNTLRARFYNSNYEMVKEIQVRDVIKALEEVSDITAIVFDGIITQRLVDLAANKGVKTLVGVKIGNVNKRPDGLEITTKGR